MGDDAFWVSRPRFPYLPPSSPGNNLPLARNFNSRMELWSGELRRALPGHGHVIRILGEAEHRLGNPLHAQ
jgi:hypothetical protein